MVEPYIPLGQTLCQASLLLILAPSITGTSITLAQHMRKLRPREWKHPARSLTLSMWHLGFEPRASVSRSPARPHAYLSPSTGGGARSPRALSLRPCSQNLG